MNPAQTSQDALGQLQSTQGGAKSAADILAGQNQKLGVQGAQDTVTGLRGAITNTTKLLNQVAPSVMGRTANSLVTNAQATRQIANEQAPISQNLNQEGQDYTQANQDYDRLNQQAQSAANMEYGDQQSKLSYLQNLYNTLFGREESARTAAAAEASRQEQIRQFNENLALEKQKAAAAQSSGIGSYFNDKNQPDAAPKAPSVQDQAYQSVQKFLQGSDAQIRSDYNATLKSANYGNAMDKLKVDLYKKQRPDLFGGTQISVGPAKNSTTILVNGKPVPANNVVVR